jgi:hypothetical protein
MARKARKPDKGPGQGWIVTFSDCMTLLLCFFVLLLTFSTFDKKEKIRIIGLFDTIRMCSIFRNRYSNSGATPPTQQEIMQAPDGSERDPHMDIRPDERVYQPPPTDDQDHLKSKRTIFVPISRLFEEDTTTLRPDAKTTYLQTMYDYLELVDCMVVFNECRMDAPSRMQGPALDRCQALIDYFRKEKNLPAERFSLGGTDMGDRSRLSSLEPLIAITFLQTGVFGVE